MPGPRALLIALPPLCNCPEPPCCPGALAYCRVALLQAASELAVLVGPVAACGRWRIWGLVCTGTSSRGDGEH